MAIIPPYSRAIAKGVYKTEWILTATSDVGYPLNAPNLPDKTVEWGGVMIANTVITIQGSNNTATGPWTTMNTASGATLVNAAGAAGLKVALQNPLFVRPAITTGTAAATRAARVTIISQSTQR